MQTLILIVVLIILIFSIIIHECAHGIVAEHYGDSTARDMGRITLNPIPHIDPIGSLLLPGIMILMSLIGHSSPIIFGWAKPVPINPYNLNDPQKNMMGIGVAGPAANLVLALILSLISRIMPISSPLVTIILFYGVTINLILAFFNLIPVPPLDGSRILTGLLSEENAYKLSRLEPFGFIIILILIMSGLLNFIFAGAMNLGILLTGFSF